MPIFEIKGEIPKSHAVEIEEGLMEREEQRLMVIEDKDSGRAWLTGYFDSESVAKQAWRELWSHIAGELPEAAFSVRQLPDEDWKHSYKIHFKAWKFGPLHWVPVWERESFEAPPGEQVLWLDPGMAFGTGNHETTRLCCERLVEFAKREGKLSKVIDAGCGSGILALSASKLGFAAVSAFDNDPEAIRVSEQNAVLNGLGGKVDFFVGDLETGLVDRSAGLVLANIQADVLVQFAAGLCAAVVANGRLVLSGILARELDQVRSAFARVVPSWETDSRIMGEWADLVLVRRD